jgi:hypothetical protein
MVWLHLPAALSGSGALSRDSIYKASGESFRGGSFRGQIERAGFEFPLARAHSGRQEQDGFVNQNKTESSELLAKFGNERGI